jgi:hypothetical protein
MLAGCAAVARSTALRTAVCENSLGRELGSDTFQ